MKILGKFTEIMTMKYILVGKYIRIVYVFLEKNEAYCLYKKKRVYIILSK